MLTLLLLVAAFAAGVEVGARYPTVLAKAQAELHVAQAAAIRAETKLKSMIAGG